MHTRLRCLLALSIVALAPLAFAQSDGDELSEAEQLKVAAIEALISAPPQRALPIVARVLLGSDSDVLKQRALFVLSQIDGPEAENLLVDVARSERGELRADAVRMLGIHGSPAAMASLRELYRDGDAELRDTVMEAYLIADDADSVFAIAQAATTVEEFERAVQALGTMGATSQLRALRSRDDMSQTLIQAYANAGDIDTLRELALDASNPERQAEALRGLTMTDESVSGIVLQVYRDTDDRRLKELALEAMMMSGDDESVLTLFRESRDPAEKRELLELLVQMDSDAVWDVIDETL